MFLDLADPVVNASGTFDAIAARRAFGDALLERFPFAAFVTKTVTLAPRQGNPPPRLYELPCGLLNSIGLPNKGLEQFLAQDLPQLAELPVPLIVNVMGNAADEVATLVRTVGERDEVTALELNVSCPNVKTGLMFGADPVELAALLDAVRPMTAKPLIVKLTPNCASPADVAAAAEAARRRRRLIDQHAARNGAASAPSRRAVARREDGWRVRSGGPRDRARAGLGSTRARQDPHRGYGWGTVRPSRRRSPACGRRSGRRRHRVLPGPAGRRARASRAPGDPAWTL